MSATFPGNRQYTLNSLVEELALMERHFRDGSWRECTCNPEKHLPLIAGLASEGYGFASSQKEKQWMKQLSDKAKTIKEQLKHEINEEEADKLRSWARNKRLTITSQSWTNKPNCPTCTRKGLYAKSTYNNSGETSNMPKVTRKIVATSYGLNFGGALITKFVDPWLDTNYPGSLAGYNPSLLVDLLLGIGGPLASLSEKVKAPYDMILAGVGTYVAMNLIDQAQALMSPTAGLRYVAVTPRGSVSVAAAVPAIPAQGALGKYT